MQLVSTKTMSSPASRRRSFRPTTKTALALGLVVTLMVFYVLHMTDIATAGFEESQLQNQLVTLQKQHQTLEINAAQAQSLQTIQQNVQKLDLIPIVSVDYVPRISSVVASR